MTTPQRLAVLVVALVLGGLGAGAVTSAPEAPADSAASVAAEEADDVAATHPFLQDEVSFHASPGVNALLFGVDTGTSDRRGVVASKTQAHALAILNRPCGDEPELVAVPDSIVGAAARVGATSGADPGTVRGLKKVAVEPADAPVPTERLPGCPVELTMHAPVGAAATGHLMAVLPPKNVPSTVPPPAGEAAVTSEVLVAYSVTQFFSPGVYVLLSLSALVVAIAGLLPLLGSSSEAKVGLLKDEVTTRKYPVFAAVVTALAAVSTGAVSWSDLVPSLHLGGVTVTVMLAGVLVAVGEAVVSAADKGGRFIVGHVLRLYGIAVLALLTPLILLHGSTIGWGGAVVWGVIVALLALLAATLILTTAPEDKEKQVASTSNRSPAGVQRPAADGSMSD